MEISNHNIRALIASADLVGQNAKGELNHGTPNAPEHKVPDEAGDVDKVVHSSESEKAKNDLKEKQKRESENEKSENSEEENEESNSQDIIANPDLGFTLDINA
ncbi:MAG: hypothetical protein COA79_03190 [Planctomycetota bacterium]|nr:MAG: hypothetical protein COA79_03190 [Planctomycetota bacterium]